MDLLISNTAGQPIYEQIYSQLKAQILSGSLRPGEALPSIRSLAKDLRISVITTKRAYDELEAERLIDTVAGKGCFVARFDRERLLQSNFRQIDALMARVIAMGDAYGVPHVQLLHRFSAMLKEEAE